MDSIRKEDQQILHNIQKNLATCLLGKDEEIRLLLTALLAGGHVLLEDVPGTGKTILVKALAKSIQGEFRRIQCNPDLLPTDITGVSIYHPKEEAFVFRPGPVMTNILLVDEINRATTKTQSALLEAMEEKNVTVDGDHYPLPDPFLLLATQNPIDFEGTHFLPEAQLDRFMLKFSLGYPDRETEKRMIYSVSSGHPVDELQEVTTIQEIIEMQTRVRKVHLDESVVDYALAVTRGTREHPSVYIGASPRATLTLIQASRAFAYLNERNYVLPDDVKFLVPYVLSHRIILNSEARFDNQSTHQVLHSLLQNVKVPV